MKGLFGGKKVPATKSPVKSSLSYHEAEKLWISHPDRVWILADIVFLNEEESAAIVKSEFGESTVQLKDTHVYHYTHSANLDNLCFMNNFHEAPLLDALRTRSMEKMIYTDIGNVLVSINPYEKIEGLYDSPLAYFSLDVVDTNFISLPPHVYRLANAALCAMLKTTSLSCLTKTSDQSLVISGESGAGKTEASKRVVRFLIECDEATGMGKPQLQAHLDQGDTALTVETEGSSSLGDTCENGNGSAGGCTATMEKTSETISKRILDSTFVFESFGNAKTLRNDNSSRFGKFIKIQYGSDQRICGAHVDTFLLEQSRLAHVSGGERNYHIFYQMLRGEHYSLDKYLLELTKPEDFNILLGSGETTPPSYPDAERDCSEFTALCAALETLGCSEDDLVNIWRVLAAVLHMGNCYTESKGVDGHAESNPLGVYCSSTSIDFVARTFGVEVHELQQALTVRVIRAYKRASFSAKMLSPEEVMFNIYAVMKYLYSALFRWLQTAVNKAFGAKKNIEISSFIGILDIFGFEIMERNSFEQLCINFANELLQKLFNETIFTSEQEAYAAEGIEWQQLTFQDNQAIIDLLSLKPNGLFPTIDAQGMLNRKSGGDKALVSALSRAHLKSSDGVYSEGRFGSGEAFIIRHFAGEVEYAVEDFLDKNNSSLQEDLMEVLRISTKPFVRTIFQLDDDDDSGDDVDSGGGGLMSNVKATIRRMSSGGKHKKPNKLAAINTVSGQFKEQLDVLLDSLRQTRTHYVKCIKPNTTKSPGQFDAPLVMQQLRCNGIMELVRIKRQGYPTHSEFIDFYTVFQFLAHGKKWVPPLACTPEQAKVYTSEIAAASLPSSMYQVGHNMIFLRDGFEVMMRDAKLRLLSARAATLQTAFRRYRDRSTYIALRRKIVIIQCLVRCRGSSRRYAQMRAVVIVLQKFVRRFRCRKSYLQAMNAAAIIQRQIRRTIARAAYLRLRRSATVVVSVYRMHKQRKQYARQKSCVVLLQCTYRRARARQALRLKKLQWVAEIARQERKRSLRVLRASILITAFFCSIKRQGGREKARGHISPPIFSKGLVVRSLCKRYVNILQKKRRTMPSSTKVIS